METSSWQCRAEEVAASPYVMQRSYVELKLCPAEYWFKKVTWVPNKTRVFFISVFGSSWSTNGCRLQENCEELLLHACPVRPLFPGHLLWSGRGYWAGRSFGQTWYAISDLLSAAFDCPVRAVKGWQVTFLHVVSCQLELVKDCFYRRLRPLPIWLFRIETWSWADVVIWIHRIWEGVVSYLIAA